MKNSEIPKKSDVYLAFKKYVTNQLQSVEEILLELRYFSGMLIHATVFLLSVSIPFQAFLCWRLFLANRPIV